MTLWKCLLWLAVSSCWACSEDQCELNDDLLLFAGDTARDCGTVGLDDDRATVDACVIDAFESEEPFLARYERYGTDSKVVTALAANGDGEVKLFQWDSAPCGGTGCDAVTDVQSCDGAALSEETSDDPSALPVTCEQVGLAQRVCG
jgi:hypothetical protein